MLVFASFTDTLFSIGTAQELPVCKYIPNMNCNGKPIWQQTWMKWWGENYIVLRFLVHTWIPKNCVFRNKNHKNPEHNIIFRNTSANISPHLWNKSSYQILQENHRAMYTVHLPPLPILRSWERCLLIMLDCPPVKSYHNSTASFRVHASVTFLVNGD